VPEAEADALIVVDVLVQVIKDAGLQETVGLLLLVPSDVEAEAVQPLPD